MRKELRKVWGKIREIDQNLRKNEENENLAHPGLWGWLRPCKSVLLPMDHFVMAVDVTHSQIPPPTLQLRVLNIESE